MTSNLQHPAIVPVYEVGRWPGGQPFYAMKLVRGRAFDQVIAEASTTAARIALVPHHLIAVADALAYAHSERVIHRDLKPANVLVGPYGETVVIDWGLARNLAEPEAPAALTPPPRRRRSGGDHRGRRGDRHAGVHAPEQARGRALDERADVYAIGAILYHALAGVRPYAEAHSVAAILERVQAGRRDRWPSSRPTSRAELVAIVTGRWRLGSTTATPAPRGWPKICAASRPASSSARTRTPPGSSSAASSAATGRRC
ncbi:MAG: serine/threonine protein kinase [Kofleriaceae bacterium]|nr:serine/threonine protein kinase [Kofleriaceae bacterium]